MKTVPAIMGLANFSDETCEPGPPPEVIVPSDPIVEFAGSPQQFISQQELNESVAQARAEVEARYEQQIQQLRQESEQRLEEAALQAADNQAELLAAAVMDQFGKLGQDVAERLYGKCRPILGGLACDQAVGELTTILNRIVSDNCKITVTGPEVLLIALRARLDEHDLDIDWQEKPAMDISIAAGDTIVETQLSSWFSALEETADG